MTASLLLLVRARARVCALPLSSVVETFRPLDLRPVSDLPIPAFVLGVAVIRGEPVPVVDLGALLGLAEPASPKRWLTLRLGGRFVALAVEDVLRVVPAERLDRKPLPPLLSGAKAVDALGTLDGEFLSVLETGRLVPDETWSAL
ncbi:MAG TPA: chemotaxis protein CheW [Planctomycetota bacterium]